MNGLFCIDGPIYKDINGVMCHMNLTNEMFSRYTPFVEKLLIITRVEQLEKTYEEASLEKIDLKKLVFIEVDNLSSVKGIFNYKKVKNIVRNAVNKSDLFFVRLPSVVSNIVVNEILRSNKVYLAEVGGCAWDSYWNYNLLGKFIAHMMYLFERRGAREADYISYVTEKFLQKRYPSKGLSIVASNVYLPNQTEQVLNDRLIKLRERNKNTKLVIGTIADVSVKYKGQDLIIEAISNLNKKGLNIHYELVGGGDPSYLKTIAIKYDVEQYVHFKGTMKHAAVFDWLCNIDIYAQPSKQEGLPRALIEALSTGCIAIGSTTAGIPELLQNELIFDNGSISEIQEIIIKLLSLNTESLEDIAKKNFKKAKEFDKDILDGRRNKLYAEYINSVEKKDRIK